MIALPEDPLGGPLCHKKFGRPHTIGLRNLQRPIVRAPEGFPIRSQELDTYGSSPCTRILNNIRVPGCIHARPTGRQFDRSRTQTEGAQSLFCIHHAQERERRMRAASKSCGRLTRSVALVLSYTASCIYRYMYMYIKHAEQTTATRMERTFLLVFVQQRGGFTRPCGSTFIRTCYQIPEPL